jgi:hypothetical protein
MVGGSPNRGTEVLAPLSDQAERYRSIKWKKGPTVWAIVVAKSGGAKPASSAFRP